MELEVTTLKLALQARIGTQIAEHQPVDYPAMARGNPVRWLDAPMAGYRGEPGPEEAKLLPGRLLVLRPAGAGARVPAAAGPAPARGRQRPQARALPGAGAARARRGRARTTPPWSACGWCRWKATGGSEAVRSPAAACRWHAFCTRRLQQSGRTASQGVWNESKRRWLYADRADRRDHHPGDPRGGGSAQVRRPADRRAHRQDQRRARLREGGRGAGPLASAHAGAAARTLRWSWRG